MRKIVVLGAGVTGLAVANVVPCTIYEASHFAGGICNSYYLDFSGKKLSSSESAVKQNAYRFEIGGGHWIFGGDPPVKFLLANATFMKSYKRRSSVFLPDQSIFVPYPLQNHLSFLDRNIAVKAVLEIASSSKLTTPRTMAEWLELSFGKTLMELFFAPFHELYTAGLWTKIAPQDPYKSPANIPAILQGLVGRTQPAGYNVEFIYPRDGLDSLISVFARQSKISYRKRAVRIDIQTRRIFFDDGTSDDYDILVSTIPLNRLCEIANLKLEEESDPYTSVLVLNVAAVPSSNCPSDHWVYVPKSKARFHRVGFYSNVDQSFLPQKYRDTGEKVSMYIERSFAGGRKPSDHEISAYIEDVEKELKSWGWIEEVNFVDVTWIDVAYTWSWPDSRWSQIALGKLRENNIFSIGRYGRWSFQGIADSIKEGLTMGAALKSFMEL